MINHCVVKLLVFGEQRMHPDILHGDSILWSFLQNALDKVSRLVTQVCRYHVVALLHKSERFRKIPAIKWQISSQQCIKDDTAAPHISPVTAVLLSINDLWSCIMRTPTRGV